VVSVEHVSEDDLENYAMRTLPATEVESLEEHFLICSECRDRLQATDAYVVAMRSAAEFREGRTGE
jgi:anti-sigma factor RsiW